MEELQYVPLLNTPRERFAVLHDRFHELMGAIRALVPDCQERDIALEKIAFTMEEITQIILIYSQDFPCPSKVRPSEL